MVHKLMPEYLYSLRTMTSNHSIQRCCNDSRTQISTQQDAEEDTSTQSAQTINTRAIVNLFILLDLGGNNHGQPLHEFDQQRCNVASDSLQFSPPRSSSWPSAGRGSAAVHRRFLFPVILIPRHGNGRCRHTPSRCEQERCRL
jgi:hypothetical protein